MRRIKLVLGVAALMVAIMAAAAAPASAQVFFTSDNDEDFCDHNDCDREDICDLLDIDDEDCFDFDRDNDDFCDLLDINDEDCFDFDRDFDFEDGIFSQETEQEAESGDVDQSFDVSQTGDNSNQCVSTQGVANTGNAQNTLGVTDFGNFEDDNGDRFDGDGDLEIDEVDSSIEVSPTNTTECTSEVNQAATASG
jgi:hypothetical protein